MKVPARFTHEEKKQVFKEHQEGTTVLELTKKYNTSQTTISKAILFIKTEKIAKQKKLNRAR